MAGLKFKIDNNLLVDEFFKDCRLMGIVAPIPDYRFCWYLNNVLKFDFRINHSLEIEVLKKGRQYFFSIYQCPEKGGTVNHYLYNNKCDGEFLLPESKNLDFLWLIKDDIITNADFKMLMNSLKTLPSVQMVYELTNERIKDKQNLVF